MREHVVAASKEMSKGNWRECADFVLAVKVNMYKFHAWASNLVHGMKCKKGNEMASLQCFIHYEKRYKLANCQFYRVATTC